MFDPYLFYIISLIILICEYTRVCNTQGINGDGMVYYDFPWSGSGTEATDEQVSQIPPIYATETEEGSPTYTPPPGAAPPVSC